MSRASLLSRPRIARLRALGAPVESSGSAADRVAARLRRPLDRAWFARHARLDELAGLRGATGGGRPRILVLSLRAWTHHAAYEATLAHALALRGAHVGLLTCGGGQPVCELGRARERAPRPCDRCGWFTDRLADDTGFQHLRLADHLPWGADPRRAPAAGSQEHPAALVSAAWLAKRQDVAATTDGAQLLADFAVSAEGVSAATDVVLDQFSPDIVFALNGLFTAEQTVVGVARDRGIAVRTYEMAPRLDALVFGSDAPAPDMDTDALWQRVRDRPLTARQAADIERLLADRAGGMGAHESYFKQQVEETGSVRTALGIGPDTRVVSAFTNLAWDSALLNKDIAYSSMFDWLAQTVRSMADVPDTTLVIRVHPAEVKWGTNQPVEAELLARVGTLPANVRLVRPDEPISSYTLMAISDAVLTYTTTVGLEAATRGLSVAVAGQTHYRGRGFTLDIDDHGQIEALLRASAPLDPAQREQAMRYAHGFFFRLMVPFPLVRIREGQLARVPSDAAELAPGQDAYLDFVCDRILDGEPFLLPDELAVGVT